MKQDIELMEILIGRLSDAINDADNKQSTYGNDWDGTLFLDRVTEIRNEMLLVMGRIIHGGE